MFFINYPSITLIHKCISICVLICSKDSFTTGYGPNKSWRKATLSIPYVIDYAFALGEVLVVLVNSQGYLSLSTY